ncbi:MAG: hypothetical protein ACD_50C00083G0018 [uncultured bacterium]|nr:MAG: hypothetical protein ACD_50C00083G0018 [uncultured bacterium]OGH13210.1 MAG: hypothetical protein A2687_00730 [Candidatus Levybacteria bacterium RIFCSPHIGHO2_01_FULL_38_26]
MVERATSNESVRRYIKGAHIMGAVAEATTGTPISSETLEKWESLFSSVRIVDDRVDNINSLEERQEFYKNVKMSLKGNAGVFSSDVQLSEAMNSVRSLSESLSERERANFLGALGGTLKVTEKIKTEENPDRFSFLTRLEGQFMSRAFISLLPDEYRKRSRYRNLAKIIVRIGRSGNSLDSFFDLPDDYKYGEVKIRPTLGNRVRLLKNSVCDVGYILKSVKPSKKLAGYLGCTVFGLTQNRSKKERLNTFQD